MFVRIHDLLEIDAARFLRGQASVPEWVVESLREAPFVVVRRGLVSLERGIASSERGIPIGVRGARRNERWACECDSHVVRVVVTPQALLSRIGLAMARDDAVPALRSLPLLVERWRELRFPWGPGGSVGFELATGRHIASLQSDLDVVIYAHAPITPVEARGLRDSAKGLPAAVDIRVETPICGFSLAEYAKWAPAPILLRLASGAVLGVDPWARPAASTEMKHGELPVPLKGQQSDDHG
jgi:phosphoribosyl-dephospho-CoA transferase